MFFVLTLFAKHFSEPDESLGDIIHFELVPPGRNDTNFCRLVLLLQKTYTHSGPNGSEGFTDNFDHHSFFFLKHVYTSHFEAKIPLVSRHRNMCTQEFKKVTHPEEVGSKYERNNFVHVDLLHEVGEHSSDNFM
jgi:hypothetical protein